MKYIKNILIAIVIIISIMFVIGFIKVISLYKTRPISSFSKSDSLEFKNNFYDGAMEEFFPTIEETLIEEGFTKNSVEKSISILRSRFDRSVFENETWDCGSKYSVFYMYIKSDEIGNECLEGWVSDFFAENKDALDILERK